MNSTYMNESFILYYLESIKLYNKYIWLSRLIIKLDHKNIIIIQRKVQKTTSLLILFLVT